MFVAALGPALGDPVAFNRAPNTNATNPFGATLFYGFDDLIFEVGKGVGVFLPRLMAPAYKILAQVTSHQTLASVTWFKHDA